LQGLLGRQRERRGGRDGIKSAYSGATGGISGVLSRAAYQGAGRRRVRGVAGRRLEVRARGGGRRRSAAAGGGRGRGAGRRRLALAAEELPGLAAEFVGNMAEHVMRARGWGCLGMREGRWPRSVFKCLQTARPRTCHSQTNTASSAPVPVLAFRSRQRPQQSHCYIQSGHSTVRVPRSILECGEEPMGRPATASAHAAAARCGTEIRDAGRNLHQCSQASRMVSVVQRRPLSRTPDHPTEAGYVIALHSLFTIDVGPHQGLGIVQFATRERRSTAVYASSSP
jgi:hypothetical protein